MAIILTGEATGGISTIIKAMLVITEVKGYPYYFVWFSFRIEE